MCSGPSGLLQVCCQTPPSGTGPSIHPPALMGTGGDDGRRGDHLPTFHPEFGRFMLEATPGKPWGIGFKDLLDVERNMRWRYALGTFFHRRSWREDLG